MIKYIHILLSLMLIGSSYGQTIELELVQDGFSQPLHLQNSGDNRLFIVEKGGKIKIILEDNTVSPTPFLDLSDIISTQGEQGLLGLAFHPDYDNNGYFFVNYTNTAGNTQISRFTVSAANPDIADPGSELFILDFNQPASNHNGGDMIFGPDGYLYISSGDGGSSGDPNNLAQNINVLLGKMLRIDIDNPSGGNAYGIPPDNPFINTQDARPEIWAYGLRNPWRFSIDTDDNNIWIADVGQGSREEINRQSLDEGGVNYGWRCYEGSLPFNTDGCPPQSELVFPIAEYGHENGNCSITGGHVYRGSEYTDIAGLYFFADYCSGMIGSVDSEDQVTIYGDFPGRWVSFGQDVNKELYLLDINEGKVFRLKGSETAGVNSDNIFSFQIVPNPASELVSIILNRGEIQEITVYDVQGRNIYEDHPTPSMSQQVAISSWSSGIYFIKTTTTSGFSTIKKLIIQ